MSRDIQILNRDEVKKTLSRIPFRLVAGLPKVVDAMLAPFVKSMKQAIAADVHTRTGTLHKSIRKHVTVYKHDSVAYGIVGPSLDVSGTLGKKRVVPAFYAHLVDAGTKPHFLSQKDTGKSELVLITPKGKRRPYFRSRKVYERFGHLHPGARPHPFRTPAIAAGQAASIAAGNAAIDKLIADSIKPGKAT